MRHHVTPGSVCCALALVFAVSFASSTYAAQDPKPGPDAAAVIAEFRAADADRRHALALEILILRFGSLEAETIAFDSFCRPHETYDLDVARYYLERSKRPCVIAGYVESAYD